MWPMSLYIDSPDRKGSCLLMFIATWRPDVAHVIV